MKNFFLQIFVCIIFEIFSRKKSKIIKNIFFRKKKIFLKKSILFFFGSIEKIFFERVENFFEHQDRNKISLRIEWEHSQPLKQTLKHSYAIQVGLSSHRNVRCYWWIARDWRSGSTDFSEIHFHNPTVYPWHISTIYSEKHPCFRIPQTVGGLKGKDLAKTIKTRGTSLFFRYK